MSVNHLAPEWERQDAIIMVWPHPHSDWINNLEAIEETYLNLSGHICKQQCLIVVAYDYVHLQHVQQKIAVQSIDSKNILFVTVPTNDTWVRDYGPIFICANDKSIMLDFKFDAWGEKYSYEHDNVFNVKLIEQLNINASYENIDQILEAGNIEINNSSELLCSSTCFRRGCNAAFINLAALEQKITDWLGSSKIYWIDAVRLEGDDTDGHIDTLARYCADRSIVYSAIGHPNDVNNKSLNLLEAQLKSINKKSNNRLDLIPLPLPSPIFISNKQLPATYTNFLIANETVLVPVFKDHQDDYALNVFADLFPTREVIGIESTALIQQFGGLHCAAMQIPAGILK